MLVADAVGVAGIEFTVTVNSDEVAAPQGALVTIALYFLFEVSAPVD